MIRVLGLAAVLILAAAPAVAQGPGAEPPAAPEGGASEEAAEGADVITVIGRPQDMSLRDYASDFVLEIADPPSSESGYARWGSRICVGVMGAPEDSAQLVADRISDIARELGVRAGEPGCTPNIVVIFTDDAPALASGLIEEEPLLFRPFGGEGGTTQGLAALGDFASSDAPVRWWQITMPVDLMGRPAIETPNQLNGPPVVAGANSLIRNLVEDEIWRTYVIVDTRKIVGLGWNPLADYLAVISLAQIDPDASAAGYDSILNLFESPSFARGLTDWDRSYLTGLYTLDRRLLPRLQRGALASLIARDQRAGGDE